MILQNSSTEAVVALGREILNKNRDAHTSFEVAAQTLVETLYETFTDEEGQSMFALVRVFRLCKVEELPPEQKQAPSEDSHFLCLMGTKGDEDAWSNRLKSVGHRVIPPKAFDTPMLKAVFEQINLPRISEINSNSEQGFLQQTIMTNRYFHVETALNSPYIVAQEEFVKPYKIASVIGVGSIFPSRAFMFCLAFSKKPIDSANAQKYVNITNFITTLMSIYDGRKKLWNNKQMA
jgi:hypothetical protein